MNKYFLLMGAFLLLGLNTHAQKEIYVSPEGKDSWSGTEKRPLKSLEKARELVQQVNSEMTCDVIVYLADGYYFLDETFTLGPEDSGNNGYKVIYKAQEGAHPVVSGGRPLTGWHKTKDGMLSTGSDGLLFRQLYVNEKPATRARTPNNSYYSTKIWDYLSKSLLVNSSYIEDWKNFNEVELVLQMWWTDYYLRLESFEEPEDYTHFDWMPKYSRLRFREPEQTLIWQKQFPPKINDQSFHLENAYEFVDTCREWFLDTSEEKVYYMPCKGEDPENIQVIAPVLENIVKIEGAPGNPVHDIAFEGIRFAHSTWLRPSQKGHVSSQAGQFSTIGEDDPGHPPAAFLVNFADNIIVTGSVFRDVASVGIDFYKGVANSEINGNVFQYTGGSAISQGHFAVPEWTETDDSIFPDDERVICHHNRISNNYINKTGRLHYGSIGIASGFAANTVVEHNEIWETPYTGISMGWGWTPKKNPMHNNIIRNNHIHNVLELLCDGGGIYTLSNQPGGIIKENLIHDIQLSKWALGTINSGIYLDEYTNEVTVEMNLLEDIMDDPIYNIKRNTTLVTTFIKNELWYRRFTEDHIRVREEAGPEEQYHYMKEYLR